jgi:hypothetical protein
MDELDGDVRPDYLVPAVRRSVGWRRLVAWLDAEHVVSRRNLRTGNTVEVD